MPRLLAAEGSDVPVSLTIGGRLRGIHRKRIIAQETAGTNLRLPLIVYILARNHLEHLTLGKSCR